jgi:hypothetical protein
VLLSAAELLTGLGPRGATTAASCLLLLQLQAGSMCVGLCQHMACARADPVQCAARFDARLSSNTRWPATCVPAFRIISSNSFFLIPTTLATCHVLRCCVHFCVVGCHVPLLAAGGNAGQCIIRARIDMVKRWLRVLRCVERSWQQPPIRHWLAGQLGLRCGTTVLVQVM